MYLLLPGRWTEERRGNVYDMGEDTAPFVWLTLDQIAAALQFASLLELHEGQRRTEGTLRSRPTFALRSCEPW